MADDRENLEMTKSGKVEFIMTGVASSEGNKCQLKTELA